MFNCFVFCLIQGGGFYLLYKFLNLQFPTCVTVIIEIACNAVPIISWYFFKRLRLRFLQKIYNKSEQNIPDNRSEQNRPLLGFHGREYQSVSTNEMTCDPTV